MVAQRRLASQVKRERVIAAVDARLAAGQEVSLAGLARQAGVSRKFIYTHPDLRAQIEQRAQQAIGDGKSGAAAGGQVTIASLRADAANAKAQNRRLREQLRTLEQRLSEALGQEIAGEIDPTRGENINDLRRGLEDAQARIFDLEEALADAREELEAVREINRELLSAQNRGA